MNEILNSVAGFFKSLFEKDFMIKILSILSAIIIWFVVVINNYPTISTQVFNVPVVVNMQGTYAEAHNFRVVSQSVTEATVYVTGKRGEVGNLTNEDLEISVSAANVINAAEYHLPLEVVSKNGREFTVDKVAAADKSSVDFVTVNFDEIITKEITVKPRLDNVHIAAGFISDEDDVVIAPETIIATGPKDLLNDVTDVYIYVEAPGELSSDYEYTAEEPVLYSGESPLENSEGITLNTTSFTVNIPILQRCTLPLEVSITNAPVSFNTEAFLKKLEFSAESLEIAAPSESLKDGEYGETPPINIGSIDMREVNIGSVFTFRAEDFLPEGYQNLSSIDTIAVTCPSDGLGWINLTVRGSAVQIVNAPPQFDYNIITSGFTLVFIGSEESLEQLTYIDVISQIDLINYELEARDYKFPVTFSTPAFDDVWCISTDGVLSPKATVTVTLKDNQR